MDPDTVGNKTSPWASSWTSESSRLVAQTTRNRYCCVPKESTFWFRKVQYLPKAELTKSNWYFWEHRVWIVPSQNVSGAGVTAALKLLSLTEAYLQHATLQQQWIPSKGPELLSNYPRNVDKRDGGQGSYGVLWHNVPIMCLFQKLEATNNKHPNIWRYQSPWMDHCSRIPRGLQGSIQELWNKWNLVQMGPLRTKSRVVHLRKPVMTAKPVCDSLYIPLKASLLSDCESQLAIMMFDDWLA